MTTVTPRPGGRLSFRVVATISARSVSWRPLYHGDGEPVEWRRVEKLRLALFRGSNIHYCEYKGSLEAAQNNMGGRT